SPWRILPPGSPHSRCPWLCWQSSTRPAGSWMTAATAEVSESIPEAYAQRWRKPRGAPGWPAAVACAPVKDVLAAIPSPTSAAWQLGPLTLRAYALCIILGIVVACWIAERRMRARGAPPYLVLDVAIWAVPAGIVGARVYSLITSPQEYFGKGIDALEPLKIWHG